MLQLHLTKVLNNTSDRDGGGIHVVDEGSLISVDRAVFFGNNASNGGGGALVVSNGSSAVISSTDFISNVGRAGGAVVAENSTLTVRKGLVAKNWVVPAGNRVRLDAFDGHGGAVFIRWNATVDVVGTRFTQNTATEGGGAIYLRTGSNVSVTDAQMINNTANWGGGAICIYAASLRVVRGNLSDNNAMPGNGGAIFSQTATEVTVISTIFINNTVYYVGAAVHVEDTPKVLLNGTHMEKNSALFGFGALMVRGSNVLAVNTTYKDNWGVWGGGIYVEKDTAVLNLVDSLLEGNIASQKCGGMMVSLSSKTVITNSVFRQNTCPMGRAGAVCIGGNVSFTAQGSTFDGNNALIGGAVLVEGNNLTAAHFNGCRFTNNSAAANGGALLLVSQGSVYLDNSTLDGNRWVLGCHRASRLVSLTHDRQGSQVRRDAAALFVTHTAAERITCMLTQGHANPTSATGLLRVAQSP